MDLFRYLGPLGGAAAGALTTYLALSGIWNAHIDSQNNFISSLRHQLTAAEAKLESANAKVSQNEALNASLQKQLATMVNPADHATVSQSLMDANRKITELRAEVSRFTAQPFPAVQERVTYQRKWRPWGEAGPSFTVEDISRNYGPGVVKVKSEEAGGEMILALQNDYNTTRGTKPYEQFKFNNQVIYVILLDAGSTSAELVVGPPASLGELLSSYRALKRP